MKVLLTPQFTNTNLKHVQQKNNTYKIAPTKISKMDSVSFTGKDKALKGIAGEIVELLPRLKKGLINSFSYSEGTEFAGVQKFRLNVFEENYVITRKTTKDRGFFGREFINNEYSVNKNNKKNQHLKKEEYEKLVGQLKEFASSTILKKHGYEDINISAILHTIGHSFSSGHVSSKYSTFFQEESHLLHGVSFNLSDKKQIFLIKTPKQEVYKIGFKTGSQNQMDVFPITEKIEIEQAQQLLKMNELKNSKIEIEKTKVKLKEEARVAEEKSDDYDFKSRKTIADIEKEFKELAKGFNYLIK